MAGEWVPIRTLKKKIVDSGNSGDIVNLRDYSDGVPWNNPQILLNFFGWFPDLTKYRYYTKVIHLYDDTYQFICEMAGWSYDSSFVVADVPCNVGINNNTILYNGNYHGITYDFNSNYGATPYKGTAGQDSYASGTLFNSIVSSNQINPTTYYTFYSASYFSPTLKTGVINVVNTRKTVSGVFKNIRIFTQPSEIATGLPLQWIVLEGDY